MYDTNTVTDKTINNQVMAWFAKYFDGKVFEEFHEDGTQNGFFDIDKLNLKEFGLFGGNNRLWFDTRDGVIHTMNSKGNRFGLRFHLEDEDQNLIKITDREAKYNDIIQYKKFHADIDFSSATIGKEIPASADIFYFGYKLPITVDQGIINAKVLMIVNPFSTEAPVTLQVSLTSTFDFDGYFVMYANDDMVPVTEVQIRANEAATVIEKVLV